MFNLLISYCGINRGLVAMVEKMQEYLEYGFSRLCSSYMSFKNPKYSITQFQFCLCQGAHHNNCWSSEDMLKSISSSSENNALSLILPPPPFFFYVKSFFFVFAFHTSSRCWPSLLKLSLDHAIPLHAMIFINIINTWFRFSYFLTAKKELGHYVRKMMVFCTVLLVKQTQFCENGAGK